MIPVKTATSRPCRCQEFAQTPPSDHFVSRCLLLSLISPIVGHMRQIITCTCLHNTHVSLLPSGIRFQCCDTRYIKFANWQSWSKCDGLEDRRINLHACPTQPTSPSNFSFITIFIVLTVLVIVFGLAIVLFKRLRYQSQRRSHGAANSSPGRGRTTTVSAAAPRRSSASPTAHGESRSNPTGTGNDLAPPSYEEAILLTDRPPAFDKL